MSYYRKGELIFQESRNSFNQFPNSAKYDLTLDRESSNQLSCDVLLLGMPQYGAWSCEAYAASSHSQLVETISIVETKDGTLINHYDLSIYEIPSERRCYLLWFNNSVESLLSSMLVDELLSVIRFNACIIFDVIPFPNRTTLLYSTDTLYRLSDDNSLSELNTVPVLPSPCYVTGLAAEFFTKCCILKKTVYALFSCPEEEFSIDPVVALGGGIHRITGIPVDEGDFCNVANLVIKRKECVSAYSHIYL